MHVSPALLEANQPLGAFLDEKGPPLRQARGLAPLAQHGRLLRHGQEGLGLGKTRGLGFTHAWTEGGWWGGHSCGRGVWRLVALWKPGQAPLTRGWMGAAGRAEAPTQWTR